MEEKKDSGNALKQALNRRQTENLPSNFSFRMMELVHVEAEKQRKRKERLGFASLIMAVLALLGLGGYYVIFKLKFCLGDYMLQVEDYKSSPAWGFYCYIALLALVLLGLDYWMRKRNIWK